jgi:guanylate kinase
VTPRIVVLSAPSGGGKTTIAKAVREQHPDRFGFSVSATTRKPRPGERHAVDYHFWTRQQFKDAVRAGRFLEHAEYAGELYGTLKDEIEKVLKSGRHVLLDIDVEGARQVRMLYPDDRAITIFILPSDPKVLVERLVQRKSESPREIKQRVDRAMYELGQASDFDRFVRNDSLDDAIHDVVTLVDEGGGFKRTVPLDVNWIHDYGSQLQGLAQRAYDEMHKQKG